MSVTSPASAVAVYRGTVSHRRHEPVTREFAPRLALAYLDVDALPDSLDRLPLWSARRAAPVWFRRRDFFDGGEQPLGDAIRDLVAERLGRRPQGRVDLLAHLRTFGWLHNPLAVYYCRDSVGDLDAIVLEVTNTPWGERHWYVCDAAGGVDHGQAVKAMHVSPFLPMDVDYRMSWTAPGDDLALRIEVGHDGEAMFDAYLALRREPLDRRHAWSFLLRDPLPTHRVSAGIYGRALGLFLARVPLYSHPDPHPEPRPGRRSGSERTRTCEHG